MEEYKIVEIKEDIRSRNNEQAKQIKKDLAEKKIFYLNVMASPGSGKTTLIVQLVNGLKDKFRIGIIEADIDSDVDAKTIAEQTGVKVMQMHTGGACHITCQMSWEALEALGIDDVDFVILENIGNLVCPAEFDTGSNINMMLLSVPEGHDKPLKYPLMFQVSNIAVITKIDTLPVFDFDFDKCEANIHKRNPNAKMFKVSAVKDEGTEELAKYIDTLITNSK